MNSDRQRKRHRKYTTGRNAPAATGHATPWPCPDLVKRIDRSLARLFSGIERSGFGHLILIAVGVFTVYQLAIDLWDRQAERTERRESRVERAWDTLRSPTDGEQSKGTALNVLFREGEPLTRQSINCEGSRGWTDSTGTCSARPNIFNADFTAAILPTNARSELAQRSPTICRDSRK